MPNEEITALLGEWEGYRVGFVERHKGKKDGSASEVWIELIRRDDVPMICSGCGQGCERYHDWDERWIRDLPILDAETHLLIQRFRVACPVCGPKLEHLPWLAKYARVTGRFARSVARLCKVLPIKHVAKFYGLGWDTVKAIDKAWLEATLGEPDLTELELLAMDEFAIKRGHRYATIFVEPNRKEVLWVCRGRSREDIRPFFEKLGAEGCQRIEAVAMDMSASYEAEVKAQCPKADIVYDFFHVVAKYGREVIDKVRTAEAKRQTNQRERQVIKGSRWLLLRNSVNLKRKDRVRLRELLAVNRRLATVYMLKDDLKSLWDYRYPRYAMDFFREWYARAIRSRIAPLKRFARQLRDKIDGILAHCKYPLHTSLLEGMNNKIKVIKRMAYGYRDEDYFFLKIRATFPGIPG
ncbi:MAG: ISL3 family transposase [Phycisphaerae bacterium]